MSLVKKYLPWDSVFFNKKIGSVFLEEEKDVVFLNQCLSNLRNEQYDLVYLFSNRDLVIDASIINSNKGLLVDNKVIYEKVVNTGDKSPFITDYMGDPSSLYSLSKEAGLYSRFKIDPNFSKLDFVRFYNKWIENSINREIADYVFVYKDDFGLKGMLTAKKENESMIIGLFSVEKKYRGLGIGSALMKYLMGYCCDLGLKKIQVATQLNNINACQFYEKSGMTPNNITSVYHFWLNNK